VRAALRVLVDDEDADLKSIFLDAIPVPSRKKQITPKTLNQKRYVEAIRAHDIVVGIGPAGTGKSYLAMAMAVSAMTRLRRDRGALWIAVESAREAATLCASFSEDQVQAVTTFVLGLVREQIPASKRKVHDPHEIAANQGMRLVSNKNCLGCHQIQDFGGDYAQFVEDASFVKLREVALRYNLESAKFRPLTRVGIERAVLSLIGRNLHFWTSYSGYDPEVNGSGLAHTRIDDFDFASYRTITASIEIIF